MRKVPFIFGTGKQYSIKIEKTCNSSGIINFATINYQLSTINYQLSTINYQLSTINHQLDKQKLKSIAMIESILF